ncbi:phage tail protein [Cellulomonas uda]|uniref:Bacteriophage tail tape measure N-terminal domain-containing protein n=1 Tax=Cellulomonas uda TaxID=1714 RepID=A0A4Y3K7J6_CELUD|nr:hypothetical protein [Cellulomonas uda]NII67821.1 phage-related protein [Cellulomonas uda]GEA79932.1 hypothetical protein CUD01_03760 [Cellulomonas uda]
MAGKTTVLQFLLTAKDRASGDFDKVSGAAGRTRGALSKLKVAGGVALGALAAGVGAWAVESVNSLGRIEQIGAQTEAAIKSTGGAAQRTREQIDNLAGSIEGMSGVEAETITQGQNLLLTFTNIKGATFDDATRSMTDMAVALNKGSLEGLDMSSSAQMLGKALNDPVAGVSKLTKIGVTFTQAQKDQIKAMAEAGDVAGAQSVILQELQKEFGGSAEAAGRTTVGKFERVQHALGTMGETIFAKVLPAVSSVSDFLLTKGVPAFDAFAGWVGDNVAPALGRLGEVISTNVVPFVGDLADKFQTNVLPALKVAGSWVVGTLVPALASMGSLVVRNKDWLVALAVGVGGAVLSWKAWHGAILLWQTATKAAAAVQAAFDVVMSANPVLLVVAAVAALVAGLTYFFTQTETGRKVWAGFTSFLSTAWERIKAAFSAGWNAVKGFLGRTWDLIKKVWSFSPLGLIVSNWSKITGFFASIPGRVSEIFNRALGVIKTVWAFTPLGIITKNWGRITAFFSGIPGKVKGYFSSAVSWLRSAGSQVLTGLKSGLESAWTSVLSWVSGRKDAVVSAFSGAVSWLREAGGNVVQGLLNGIGDLAGTIGTWFLNKVPGWIRDPFKKALGIHSPSTEFAGYGRNLMEGLLDKGIGAHLDKVTAMMSKLVERIKGTKGLLGKDALVDLVTARTRALTAAYKAQEAAVSRLRSAQEKYADLVNSRKEMVNEIRGNLTGQLDLGSLVGQTDENGYKRETTFSSVSGAVKSMAAKAKKFAGLMRKMVKIGIPRALVQQVAGMGFDEGTEVAKALVSGSAAEVASLRRSWAELDKWSASAGRVVAGQQYDPAIREQRDVVKERQEAARAAQRDREKLAKEIAKEIAAALERAQFATSVNVKASLAVDGRAAAQVTKVGITELRRSGDRTV